MLTKELDLEANKYLAQVFFDGVANMIGSKSGVSTRLEEEYPQVVTNHCTCHGSALPVKGAFRDMLFLKNFGDKIQDLIRLFKFSPQRELCLENCKSNAPKDRMNDVPSEAGKLIPWIVARWTENRNAIVRIKYNWTYLRDSCLELRDARITSDPEK